MSDTHKKLPDNRRCSQAVSAEGSPWLSRLRRIVAIVSRILKQAPGSGTAMTFPRLGAQLKRAWKRGHVRATHPLTPNHDPRCLN